VTDQAATEPAPTRGARAGAVAPLAAVGIVLGAGVLWGLLWWWLAPTARTVVQDGGVYLQGHEELMVGQDGWFVVLGAIAGAVLATVWPALWWAITTKRPIAGLFAGMAGCLAAGLVAWGLGAWLGPDPLTSQLAHGVKAPVTPLALHTRAALLFAPFLFVVVRGLMELLGSALGGMHTEPPPPATSTSALGPAPTPSSASLTGSADGSAPQGVHIEQRQ
jgi:hypothetical protein